MEKISLSIGRLFNYVVPLSILLLILTIGKKNKTIILCFIKYNIKIPTDFSVGVFKKGIYKESYVAFLPSL